jgi:hypothetical protein
MVRPQEGRQGPRVSLQRCDMGVGAGEVPDEHAPRAPPIEQQRDGRHQRSLRTLRDQQGQRVAIDEPHHSVHVDRRPHAATRMLCNGRARALSTSGLR